jgi:hypothetical protein
MYMYVCTCVCVHTQGSYVPFVGARERDGIAAQSAVVLSEGVGVTGCCVCVCMSMCVWE